MPEYEELKLAVNLVDNASTGLKNLNTEISKLGGNYTKTVAPQMVQANRQIGESFGRVKTEIIQLQPIIGQLGGSFGALGTSIGTVLSRTGGGAGIVGIFTAVGGAILTAHGVLRDFTRSLLDLRDAARAAGVPPDLFKGYINQLREFGYTQQQAEQEVTKFFRTIREVAKPGTAEFQRMFEFTGGDPRSVAFFRDIARMSERGEFGAALTKVAQKANEIFRRELVRTGSQQSAYRATEAFLENSGLSLRALNINRTIRDQLDPGLQHLIRASEEWNQEWVKTELTFARIGRQLKADLLETFKDLNKELLILQPLAQGFANILKLAFQTVSQDIKDFKKILEILSHLLPRYQPAPTEGELPSGPMGNWGARLRRRLGLPDVPGAAPQGAPQGGGGTGGQTSVPQVGGRDLADQLGIGDIGGPPTSGGVAPERMSGRAPTLADRNNNPGNIEWGPFAQRHGATGPGQGGRFAQFPDRETGFKAAEALIGGRGYAGLTLAQIGARWAEGDPNWARNVSRATGIPLDAVPTPEQRTQIARVGIPRAEGSAYGRGATPGAAGTPAAPNTGDPTVPSGILARARMVAASGGPGALQAFMRQNGYPKSGAWCGQFAAAVVRSSGGTPPPNAAIASNWRLYGEPTATPQPGDIAVAKPGWSRRGSGRTGDVGSHVTIVESVDPRTGTFRGFGGNQGGALPNTRPFSTRRFDFRRPTDLANPDRSPMDRVSAGDQRISGDATIRVDVNAPPGTRVGADANGIFRNVKMHRQTQMEPASSGPQEGEE